MGDWLFPAFLLVVVAGGAIRAGLASKRHPVAGPSSVQSTSSKETAAPIPRENYGNPDQRIWRFGLVVPGALLLIALVAKDPSAWAVALAMVPPALAALRFSRGGVYPTPSGLRIVNFLSTRELAWGDIDHFEERDYPSASRVILKDGTTLGVTALQPGNRERQGPC